MTQATVETIPCLSIRQPWPWLIMRPDLTDPIERERARAAGAVKNVENRDWPTKVRGRILIHASKTMTRDDYEACQLFVRGFDPDLADRIPAPADLPRGGIVGEAILTRCVEVHTSPWFCGTYGFVLPRSTPLPFMPYIGQLGFFTVPAFSLAHQLRDIEQRRPALPVPTVDEYFRIHYMCDPKPDEKPRRCRVCGCTDADCSGCIERTGEPCHWVAANLCSACAKRGAPPRGQLVQQLGAMSDAVAGRRIDEVTQ